MEFFTFKSSKTSASNRAHTHTHTQTEENLIIKRKKTLSDRYVTNAMRCREKRKEREREREREGERTVADIY